MFLSRSLFLGIALLPVLVILAAAVCAVRLLCLVAVDALRHAPAPAAARSTRRVARPRLAGAGMAA